jgi:hypothetical protein
MINSNNSEPTDYDYTILKGAFFDLSPLSIPLCLVVIIQNAVIFVHYYKERTRLVPGMFMGIALADILKAQGEIVLSVAGILLKMGHVTIETFINFVLYYMVTALPGVNWSKLFNVVMSITLTIRVVNPFSTLNTARVKGILALFCALILLLHISDMVTCLIFKGKVLNPKLFARWTRYSVEGDEFPGLPTIFTVICMPDNEGNTRCAISDKDIDANPKYTFMVYGYGAFYFICIPLTVLICMIIQVVVLKRSSQAHETTASMPNTANHATISVLWLSGLFFLCNAAYSIFLIIWLILHEITDFDYAEHDEKWYELIGMLLAFVDYLLPLIYAVVYPIILICRNQRLRESYRGHWRKIFHSCGLRCVTAETDEVE